MVHESSYDTYYILTDTTSWFTRFDRGLIHVRLSNNRFYDSLNLNNINARFYCFGHHFWDFDEKSFFFVPGNSRVPSIFNQAFWIGGLDEQGDLHVAAERYRYNGADFFHGPVSDVYDSLYDLRWYHIWNLSRADVEYHKIHWNDPGYEAKEDILTWPGNGDPDQGQAERIAPFEDMNNNGLYEPLAGDSPRIKGDQALFFVFNDDRDPHFESDGTPLGIEIRAMVYAFDAPEDSVLWNTIFLHYDIVNRSDTTYHDVYLGVFTDTDLGFEWDDRIESDVTNGMYFTYNGHEYDLDSGYYNGYGYHPPAQGIMMLGGPYMEPNGVDDARFDILGNQVLNESINGLNFGDGIIDNERLGMRTFHYFNGGGFGPGNDPQHAPSYYNYLRGLWLDGMPMSYGGFGHPDAGSVGPECRYWCPRDSDPYNWGTYGLWPNPPYNPENYSWSEEQEGFNPNDRRGLGTMGPFTLAPGQSQPLDLAFPWARDYDGTAWESALLLKERAAFIRQLFQEDSAFVSGIIKNNFYEQHILKIHPNPATQKISFQLEEASGEIHYSIFNSYGSAVKNGKVNGLANPIEIEVTSLKPGYYSIMLRTAKYTLIAKFIKL
jgi:hypothetical protein